MSSLYIKVSTDRSLLGAGRQIRMPIRLRGANFPRSVLREERHVEIK